MKKHSNLKNYYSIKRTVRFGLQEISDNPLKNEAYASIVTKLKKDKQFSDKIENMMKRSVMSFDSAQWESFVGECQRDIDKIKIYLKDITRGLERLKEIKRENSSQVQFDLKQLKAKSGVGKGLYYFFNPALKKQDSNSNNQGKKSKTKIGLNELIENGNGNIKDTLTKHFDAYREKFDQCNNLFEVYSLFITNKLEVANTTICDLSKFLNNDNHNKERVNELYRLTNLLLRDLEDIHNNFILAITIIGKQNNHNTDVYALNDSLQKYKKEFNGIKEKLEERIEDFRDPNNGIEISRATLHYHTLYKKSLNTQKIATYEEKLGEKTSNKLAKIALLVNDALYKRRTRIEKEMNSLEEKIDEILFIAAMLARDNNIDSNITLFDVANALNNKTQEYDKFITGKQSFDEIGAKQRLQFALTVLVDCDIYRKNKHDIFAKRCLEMREEAEEVLKAYGFKKYPEYKQYTEKIYHETGKANIKSLAKYRGNLYTNSPVYEHMLKTNKMVSGLKGAFKAHIKNLKEEQDNLSMLDYFAVLGGTGDDHYLLLIKREEAKELKRYIEDSKNHQGEGFVYLYSAITWKSLGKLFDQVYSDEHPFKQKKEEIKKLRQAEAEKKQQTNKDKGEIDIPIDSIKFASLTCDEIVTLLKSNDVSQKENWRELYTELYAQLESIKEINDLKKIIEDKGIFLKKVSVDFRHLQKEFSTVIIAKIKNGFKRNMNNIHHEYFELALRNMEVLKSIFMKMNPELHISYKPEADENTKTKKEKESKLDRQKLQSVHRYWREQINIAFPIEFNLESKKVITSKNDTFRVIGIDRGERKLATICHIEFQKNDSLKEFSRQKLSILPFTYYKEKDGTWIEQRAYFLDAADYKIGEYIYNGEKHTGIIRLSKQESSLNLKKYEYYTRMQKTLWLEENQEKLQEILKTENREDLLQELEKEFINTYGLKKYRDAIFQDDTFKEKVHALLSAWKNFDRHEIPVDRNEALDWYEKKIQKEINAVPLRESVASNIAGIINYIYSQNSAIDRKETFVIFENLHNLNYRNRITTDPVTKKQIINDDFIDSRHNKLSGVSVYAKIQQAIINKLQLQRNSKGMYANNSLAGEKNNQIKGMQLELKWISKAKNKKKIKDYYEQEIDITPAKQYSSILFVDPYYTSKKCPKCGVFGKKNKEELIKRLSKDYLECTRCDYKTKGNENNDGSIDKLDADFYKAIVTGDDNGSFQIALRGIQCLAGNNFVNND